MIFSRWGERDLSEAKTTGGDDTWMDESGGEGDFISVRRTYEWDEGDYQMWLTPDGEDADGEWYAVWFTDLDTDETLWVGSLKFPDEGGDTDLAPHGYSTLEIYGHPLIRPIDIPEWHVSIEPPEGDRTPAGCVHLGYGGAGGQDTSNSDIQYLDGRVHLRIGGIAEQIGEPTELTEGCLELR